MQLVKENAASVSSKNNAAGSAGAAAEITEYIIEEQEESERSLMHDPNAQSQPLANQTVNINITNAMNNTNSSASQNKQKLAQTQPIQSTYHRDIKGALAGKAGSNEP